MQQSIVSYSRRVIYYFFFSTDNIIINWLSSTFLLWKISQPYVFYGLDIHAIMRSDSMNWTNEAANHCCQNLYRKTWWWDDFFYESYNDESLHWLRRQITFSESMLNRSCFLSANKWVHQVPSLALLIIIIQIPYSNSPFFDTSPYFYCVSIYSNAREKYYN